MEEKEGIDFIDYFPTQNNSQIPHETLKSTLGLIEVPNPGSYEIPLLSTARKHKEEEGPNKIELEYSLA